MKTRLMNPSGGHPHSLTLRSVFSDSATAHINYFPGSKQRSIDCSFRFAVERKSQPINKVIEVSLERLRNNRKGLLVICD